MKASTKTFLSLIIVLVLASLAIVGINTFKPFVPANTDTSISITIILVDQNNTILFSEEFETSAGSLEVALTELDEGNDSISFVSVYSDALGINYESFYFDGVKYGTGTPTGPWILLFSDDPEYSVKEWGEILIGETTYDSLSMGASSVAVKDGMTYVMAIDY